jgi:dolichyl-phosphate beta-glucosyltransferase
MVAALSLAWTDALASTVRGAPLVLPNPAPIEFSVVIPAYNEAHRIERTLVAMAEHLDADGRSWEAIVADDGSHDQTALVVQRFAARRGAGRVRLVQLGNNRGKGAALRAAVAATRGRRVLMMDADLATPMQELPALELALDLGADIASGSRKARGAHVLRPQSLARAALGRLGNLWIRLLAVRGLGDTQCGFKLFDGALARQLFALAREDRFGIDIEVLCLAQRSLGARVQEVGVAWEHQDGSKVRCKDYLEVLLKVPRIAWSVSSGPGRRRFTGGEDGNHTAEATATQRVRRAARARGHLRVLLGPGGADRAGVVRRGG